MPAVGNPDELVLQYLQPPNPGQVQNGPQQGQLVVTAGFKSGPLESYFPANIPIGNVLPVDENQLLNNGTIQVAPQADLRERRRRPDPDGSARHRARPGAVT